jgi:NAD(P)H-dependent FMN reductase
MAFDTTPARMLALSGSLRRSSYWRSVLQTMREVPGSDVGSKIFSPNKLPSCDEDRTDRDKAAT